MLWATTSDGSPVACSARRTVASSAGAWRSIAAQGGDPAGRLGLDHDSVAGVNPRLVYCSVTGFGQTGPYSHRAGYDFLIQGMAGLMSITGQPDGTPGGDVDLYAFNGIVNAGDAGIRASGDLFVFGGPSRLAYHGIPKVYPDTAPEGCGLEDGRINITMRVTGLDG